MTLVVGRQKLYPASIVKCLASAASANHNKKTVLSQGNRAMPQLFFSV